MTRVSAELFVDPFSVDCWRHQPLLRRLQYAFRDVDWTYRLAVAVPEPLAGEAAAPVAAAAARVRAQTDMPVADGLFDRGVPASWAACEAVAAVRARNPASTAAVYRRIQAAAFAAGTPPTEPDELAALAGEVSGVDADAVRAAVGSRRATAAVGRDLERARATAAELDALEVRGDPDTVPLGGRALTDGWAPPESDGDSDDGDAADEPPASDAVFSPPVVRVETARETAVLDVREGFGEFVDVFRRFDPDLGHLDYTANQLGRKAMQAYGLPQHTAERLAYGQYDSRVRDYLDRDGAAFVPEIAAALDLDPDTVRTALRKLLLAREVSQTGPGAWHSISEQ